ncbi:MAG: phosphoenolpyruvate carboxylase, partial [Longimicrobiales bacterium]|nr:phosphoenolpyruvate carboxylase [Longimicrobiales bacterium]
MNDSLVSDSSDKDEPLRADVRALGALVGNVIREQGGDALFERVEAIRLAARRRREDSGDCSELDELLHGLSPHEARELVRSFSTYFQVVNLAE